MVQSFSIFNSNHETLYSVLVLGGWDHCYHHDWIVAGGTGNTGTQERQVFEKLSSPLALVSRDRREYRQRLKMELFFVVFCKRRCSKYSSVPFSLLLWWTSNKKMSIFSLVLWCKLPLRSGPFGIGSILFKMKPPVPVPPT